MKPARITIWFYASLEARRVKDKTQAVEGTTVQDVRGIYDSLNTADPEGHSFRDYETETGALLSYDGAILHLGGRISEDECSTTYFDERGEVIATL